MEGTIYGPPLVFFMSIEDIDFASTLAGRFDQPNELFRSHLTNRSIAMRFE